MGAEHKDRPVLTPTPEIEALGLMSAALEVVATTLCRQFPEQTPEQIKGLVQTAFSRNIEQLDQYVREVRAGEGMSLDT